MAQDHRNGGTFSRRKFIKATAASAAIGAGATLSGSAVRAAGTDALCGSSIDLNLVNGRFLTMDGNNSVASGVAIRDGRIARVTRIGGLGAQIGGAIAGALDSALGPCSHTINLRGATVIPGLIDSHVHYIRAAQLPGYQVRIIETAASIPELLQMIAERTKTVPAGQFITNVGGWNTNGLTEKRLPTVAELDSAAPQHAVYLSTTGAGGAVTNSIGRSFFQSRGIAVAANGTLNATAALLALQSVQTDGDRQRSIADFNEFAASLGVTMVTDMGTSGAAIEGIRGYDYALNLWRTGNLKVRLRSFLNSSEDPTFAVAQARIVNSFRQIGDEVFRTNGIGERVNASTTNPGFIDFCKFAAEQGWMVTQHSLTSSEIDFHISAYQAAKQVAPIDHLRWSLDHVNPISDSQIQAVKALGIGLRLQAWNYTSANPAGPPWRKLVDSGIPLGAGTDSTNVGAFNPWLMIYYMSTMKNNAGTPATPANQQITRLEALRMYTIGSACFSFDEHQLGSIEPGKLADLVVLNGDPLKVTDEQLKRLHSVLTLQAGRIVHGTIA
jgi:predicted amidohydrolase YtcJ